MGRPRRNRKVLQNLYGVHSAYHALKADRREFHKIYFQKGQKGHRLEPILDIARMKNIPILPQTRKELQSRCGSPNHQGVVLVADALPVTGVRAFLDKMKEKEGAPACLLALDGIQDPQNLGAILRSARVFGVCGIILPKDRACGLTPAVSKVSEGALEYCSVAQVVNLSRELRTLKKEGFWLVGMHTMGGETPEAVDLGRDVILILGGEDRGIRRVVMELCDYLVTIPMHGAVGSLNASNAISILLYEMMRQRKFPKKVNDMKCVYHLI